MTLSAFKDRAMRPVSVGFLALACCVAFSISAAHADADEAAIVTTVSDAGSVDSLVVGLPEQFVFNSFAFLILGALVMWMCAGFTMLESGAVRTKNASVICLKNIGLYSIAGLAYYLIGYNLMYTDVVSVIGSFDFLYGPSDAELSLIAGKTEFTGEVVENGFSVMSDWFFQMVFVATTASIVSGAIAERIRLTPFFLFILLLTSFIYPVVGAWTWGEGWLHDMGFCRFNDCARHWWLGRTCRGVGHRAKARQV